jgi:MFS transporter, DHA1 family, inner membrane transport protein
MTDKPVLDQWIGKAPSSVQIGAALGVSIMGGLMASILPILLGGLTDTARLTTVQIGQAGTAELLANGLVAGLAGAYLPHRNLRQIGTLAGILLVLANLATMMTSGWHIIIARGVSGVGCGLCLWILTGLLVRSRNAARWVGIYVVLLSLSALGLSTLYTNFLIPSYGINSGFETLAVMGGLVGLASWFMPRAFAPLEQTGTSAGGMPPLSGVVALLLQFFYIAGLLSVWFYVGKMGQQSGTTQANIGLAFSLAFGLQVAGGLAATWLSNRLQPLHVILGTGVVSLVIALVLASGISGAPYVVLVALFGGLWMFAAAYLIPFSIAIDPTMRTAMLTTGVQAFGSASGPAVASMVIMTGDVRGAMWVGAFAFAGAMVAAVLANYMSTISRPELPLHSNH